MEREKKIVVRPCDCGCCMFVVQKDLWEDGTVDYNISVQDSRYDHGINTLWGRLKRAFRALFGKPVYFNDLFMDGEAAYGELLREMQELQRFGRADETAPEADFPGAHSK